MENRRSSGLARLARERSAAPPSGSRSEAGAAGRDGYGPKPATRRREGRALSPSRAAVLDAVHAAREPVSPNRLSAALGLHQNTVREHLEALVERGLVTKRRAGPSGRGRPAWLYAPSPHAPAESEYAGLAATLAAHIARTSSDPRRDAITAGRSWGRELAQEAGPPREAGAEAVRRHVAALLDRVGFAPRLDRRATTARLTQCPLLETAKRFPEVVCGVHLGIVQGALEEYGADGTGVDLRPFSEPGACRLVLGRSEP